VGISEETGTFALYSINWLVFITVVESVYCMVQADSSSLLPQSVLQPLVGFGLLGTD
jgi:hypothetical protein